MDELVSKLSTGSHPVLFEPRTTDPIELQERFERGFVFIKFTETQGGTEIGIDLDMTNTDASQVNFLKSTGNLHIEGSCSLNFQQVRCIADIDLSTKEGRGCLLLV